MDDGLEPCPQTIDGTTYYASYEGLGVHVTAYLLCIRKLPTSHLDCRAISSRSMQKSKEHM
jgi:hypothetical protein